MLIYMISMRHRLSMGTSARFLTIVRSTIQSATSKESSNDCYCELRYATV
jgi:hypothetical protein